MLNVLYILEALRHNNIMPGLLPGWNRKDIEQLPKFFQGHPAAIFGKISVRKTILDLEFSEHLL